MAQRSHYVPQFYLENFVTPGEKTLWVFDKRSRQFKAQLPIDTAVIKDFYLSSHEKKEKSKSIIETWFSQIEGAADIVIKKWIMAPDVLDKADIEKILPFIVFLHSRVPRQIEIARQIAKIAIDEAAEKIREDAKDVNKVRKKYDKFCQETGNIYNITFNDFLEMSRTLGVKNILTPTDDFVKGGSFSVIGSIGECLSKMNWVLLVAKNGDYFVTNDSPLNVFCLSEDNKAMFGAGFGLANVEITLPVSPRVCLKINKKNGVKTEFIDSGYVSEINRRVCHMADTYIYSTYKNDNLTKIMLEFAHSYKLPKLDLAYLKERFKKAFSKGSG